MDPEDLHGADNLYAWAGECSAAPDNLCQPTETAAATCLGGAIIDLGGCATCVPEQGDCDLSAGGLPLNTTIWDWLARLNSTNFAGHSDWRVPTASELESIVDYATADPALPSAFGEPSGFLGGAAAWSATTGFGIRALAWFVEFDAGRVSSSERTDGLSVRAVRNSPD
jgi:hypothetical protein